MRTPYPVPGEQKIGPTRDMDYPLPMPAGQYTLQIDDVTVDEKGAPRIHGHIVGGIYDGMRVRS